MTDFLANFPTSDLAPYERAFNPEDYRERWWLNSSLLATIDGLHRYLTFDPARNPPFLLDVARLPKDAADEADRLALAILEQWSADAAADGSRFVIVDLPLRAEIQTAQSGGQHVNEPLRRALEAQYEWIETLDAFPSANLDAQFAPGGHYSPAGNEIIALVITRYMMINR
jgi:hypothetical protein